MRNIALALAFVIGSMLTIAGVASADQPVTVTICHVAGLAEDPANTVTLTLPENAVYGQAGHFNEDGTTQAGHEQDTLGACPEPTPTEPPPTSPPPTPTSPPPVVTPPPVVCEPSIGLGPWYGDPQIDITLEGPARFRVRGGVQRAAHSDTGVNIRVFRVTLACDETLVIDHYKVKKGHYLSIFQNGVRLVYEKPPVLSR
jgi:hypothetical protein